MAGDEKNGKHVIFKTWEGEDTYTLYGHSNVLILSIQLRFIVFYEGELHLEMDIKYVLDTYTIGIECCTRGHKRKKLDKIIDLY